MLPSNQEELFNLTFFFIYHIYPLFTRKRIASLYFGRDVRTNFGLAISEVSGPPVFHIKVGASVKCLAQEHNKRIFPACSPQPPLNAERQAGKLWIPFLKVFW